MPKPTYAELAHKVKRLAVDLEKTQRLAREQAIGELKWQWQTTFDAVGASICVLDTDWNVLQCNRATSGILGKSNDEIIGRKCFEVVHDADRPHEMCPIAQLIRTRQRAVEILRIGEQWVEVAVDPILDASGNLQGIVHIITDISAHKAALDRVEKGESELRRSEQRFRALAELLPQTVYEMDFDGRLTFVNKNAYKMFGYTVEEFEQGLSALGMVVPEDRERALSAVSSVLAGAADSEGRRFTALRKDGGTFPVLIYSTVMAEDGIVKGLRGLIVDISEHERLLQEKDRLEEQYVQSQKMEAIGRLAGGVAHDLNNMLTPIVGYSEVILGARPAEAPDREMLEQILSAALRAKDMVQQLLAFSRKQTLEIKPVSLNQILAGFESLLDRILRDDVQLELKLSRGVANILADAGQIEQVVMNLAVNAQDAMPHGGKITIEAGTAELAAEEIRELQLVASGPYVVLAFGDTGHGMDARTMARIFDPFFTTKAQGKGTGLGLATVYGIVKQHNGGIRVESEPGKGAVFKIYFPAAPALAGAEDTATGQAANPRGTENLLIVEDNPGVRMLAENVLKQYGYRTVSAAGGEECQALLTQGRHFDLLLTDVVLEDTNGKDLYHLVRQHYPAIRVLYMSGYTDDVIVDHGVLEAGIAFIQKPFMLHELLRKVRQVLDGPEAI